MAPTLIVLSLMLGRTIPAQAQAADTTTVADEPITAVMVSARKRDEPVTTVPAAITIFTAAALEDFDIRSFRDYAALTPDLSFSYGGGPTGFSAARTVAIRGISGQNLIGTAGATGLYLDDTPVPVSIDPRVLDVHDIEVLKGPQGTLYGESALGGNIRLILNRPDLSRTTLAVAADAGGTTGADGADLGAHAIANLAVIPQQLAIRAVAFADHDAGYLTRTYPAPGSAAAGDPFLDAPRARVGNQGADTSYGGSITALWRTGERLDVQLRLLGEQQTYHGFPAAFAPLPAFRPSYASDRAFNIQPSASDEWTLSALDLTYRGTGFTLVSSSSFFDRGARDVEDSTYGTQQVLASVYQVSGLPAQPFGWIGNHADRQVTSETRISFEPVHGWSGIFGMFYSNARTDFDVPPTTANGLIAATAGNTIAGPAPSDLIWTQSNPGRQEDASVFGELYYRIFQPLTLTLGARQYWLRQYADYTADGFLNLGATPSDPQHNSQKGLDPKYVLSYQVNERAEFYVSAAKGFRAGGAQPYAPFCTLPDLPTSAISMVKSDTLWSFEAGTKLQLSDPDVLITMAAYHIDWNNLQQQVALPCGAYFDVNGRAAQVTGAESEVVGQLAPGLEIRMGVGYEHTALTEPGALADAGVLPGTRLSGIPTWTAAIGAAYHRALDGESSAFVAADYSYTGDSISLLNGGASMQPLCDLSYALVNLQIRLGTGAPLSFQSMFATSRNARPNLGGHWLHWLRTTFDANGLVIPAGGDSCSR